MGKFNLPGIGEIETQGNGISPFEFDAIKRAVDNRSSVNDVGYASTADLIDPNTGYYNLPEVDTHIRYLVSASPNLESTVKTLRKYFTDIKQDELDPTNFIVLMLMVKNL